MGKLVDKGTCMYPKWTSSLEILGVQIVCGLIIPSVSIPASTLDVAFTLLFSDITSDTMGVVKELQWFAAAGECGRTATSYRLVTSDKSVRLTVYETILWTCTVCVLCNVVVA